MRELVVIFFVQTVEVERESPRLREGEASQEEERKRGREGKKGECVSLFFSISSIVENLATSVSFS